MNEIKEKIEKILASTNVGQPSDYPLENEMIEEYDEFEYEELYSDIYVLVKNIDDFYGQNANQKAAMLVESFLLETMVLLKKDPENIVVESGEFYVKSTGFTPDGDVLMNLFEDTVMINTMLDLYNQALADNDFPRMEVGIGLATFVSEEFEEENNHECDCKDDEECKCKEDEECDCKDDEECECNHNHEEDDFDYGIDFNNTAAALAEMANSEELDPIVLNNIAYDLLSEIDETFFENHLEAFLLDDDVVIYHGNIVSEE
ncbi:MAG: hypothetical protein KJ971_00850 [Firmicutes bacterium]|nr:hypothetical protein [Bacillota bacterium]